MVMNLSCLRCKQKKIKCDKVEKKCGQCAASNPSPECVYVERRKRPRLAQQKQAVGDLARRLESIERQIYTTDPSSPSSLPPHTQESPNDTTPATDSTPSPSTRVMTEGGPESWIYRLADDARHNFEKVNRQSHPTLAHSPIPTIDPAMIALGEALEDLGKLRVRSDQIKLNDRDFHISTDKAKMCIDIFLDIIGSMVIPDLVAKPFGLDILEALPGVMESPLVMVDSALRVLYYNALFYGLHKIHGPGSYAQGAYYKCLEAVPAWLDRAKGTDMDCYAAAITSWTSILNFDYLLSWKFHVKSCQFLKMRGIDQLDVQLAKTHAEEEARQTYRFLYWQVLQTDLTFRLFYNKPSAIRWSPHAVKPPALFTRSNMQPTVPHTMLYVFWIRFVVLTVEIFETLHNLAADIDREKISLEVDIYCSKMESLIEECALETYMNSPKTEPTLAYNFADHLVNTYASIIGVKRQARRLGTDRQVDAITLRSARKIMSIILQFNIWRSHHVETDMVFVHFISFYPFCAVFSLYEHILASNDPEACEEDVYLLERTASAMKEACKLHPEYVPITNTILALNKVCRTMQDSRRLNTPSSIDATTDSRAQPLADLTHSSDPSQAPISTLNDGSNLPASFASGDVPGLEMSIPFPQNLSFDTNDFYPLSAMRALENEFTERNWNETWWDMDGDIDMGLDNTSSLS